MERYRTTLILLAVLVVLGALAFFLNNQSTATNVTPTPEPTQYVWRDDNQVIGIDVLSGTQKVALRKNVTTTIWSIIEPVQAEADGFAVGSVADRLKELEATAIISNVTDLSQYELAAPGLTVTATFSDTQNTRRTIQIGGTTIDGAGYYAKQPDSNVVYVVSNALIEPLKSWLTTPPERQPTPTPLPQATIVPPPTNTPLGAGTPTGATTTTPVTGTVTITSTAIVTGTTTVTGTATPGTPATNTTPTGTP
jgi:hypothetical protein